MGCFCTCRAAHGDVRHERHVLAGLLPDVRDLQQSGQQAAQQQLQVQSAGWGGEEEGC